MARPQASGTTGSSLWRDGAVLMETGDVVGRGRDPGSPHTAWRRRLLTDQDGTSSGHRAWRSVLLWDHELSRIRHGSSPALIRSAGVSGGNSAMTTIRPASYRGQTRVEVTVD